MNREYRDYEKDWEEDWREIVTNPDGTLNLDQIKRELSDYGMVMDTAIEVYCEFTNGRISKPNTTAQAIIQTGNEAQNEMYSNIYTDDINSILKEDMSDADKIYEIKKYLEIE